MEIIKGQFNVVGLMWKQRNSEHKKEKFSYFAMALIMFISILGTQSRAPLIAVVIGVPLLYFHPKIF